MKAWYRRGNNAEKARARARKYRLRNGLEAARQSERVRYATRKERMTPAERKAWALRSKLNTEHCRRVLSDSYVRATLKSHGRLIGITPPESLVELQRTIIQLKRVCQNRKTSSN